MLVDDEVVDGEVMDEGVMGAASRLVPKSSFEGSLGEAKIGGANGTNSFLSRRTSRSPGFRRRVGDSILPSYR